VIDDWVRNSHELQTRASGEKVRYV